MLRSVPTTSSPPLMTGVPPPSPSAYAATPPNGVIDRGSRSRSPRSLSDAHQMDNPVVTADANAWSPGSGLSERVIIITGASAGLGRQFANALNAAGAHLVLAARRSDRLEEVAATLRDPLIVPCDVAAAETPELIAKATIERFGRIDGLVNNAGITLVRPALRESVEEYRRIVEVNLVAPFAMAKAAAVEMRK